MVYILKYLESAPAVVFMVWNSTVYGTIGNIISCNELTKALRSILSTTIWLDTIKLPYRYALTWSQNVTVAHKFSLSSEDWTMRAEGGRRLTLRWNKICFRLCFRVHMFVYKKYQ